MLCSRVQNQLSAYSDRELTGAEMLAMQGHLARCSECRQEYDGLLQIKRLMGALSNVEPPRPFDRSFLASPPRLQPRWLRVLMMHVDQACEPLREIRRSWVASLRLRHGAGQLSLACGLVAIALAAGLLTQPPRSAVGADVPEIIPVEESAVALSAAPQQELLLDSGDPAGSGILVPASLLGTTMPRVVLLPGRRRSGIPPSNGLRMVDYTTEAPGDLALPFGARNESLVVPASAPEPQPAGWVVSGP